MPKRGNENAQMRREDYEALESSSKGKEVSHGFERASNVTIGGRKIVSATRPGGASFTSSGDDDNASKSNNPFANVSLVTNNSSGSASKPSFSFGTLSSSSSNNNNNTKSSNMPGTGTKPFAFGGTSSSSGGSTPAPAPASGFKFGTNAPAPSTGGGFSFGNSSSAAASGGFSFGGGSNAPAPAPAAGFSFGTGNTASGNSGKSSSSLRDKYQKNARLLEDCFQKEITQYPIKNTLFYNLVNQYIDGATVCLENMYWSEVSKGGGNTGAAQASASSETPKSTAASFGSTATPGTLFGSTPASTATTPATVTADTPGFAEDAGELGEGATPSGPPSLIGGTADEDWTDLKVIENIHVYHYRNKETNGPTKFCTGTLKVQEHSQSKTRRMVMRDPSSGKVQLNLAIAKDMPIGGGVQKSKRSGQGIDHALFMSVQSKEIGNEKFSLKRRVVAGQPTLKEALSNVTSF